MITDEQYRFYNFCLENDRTKSERQKNYFLKSIEEYEEFNKSEEYEVEKTDGLCWIDYMEITILGMMFFTYSYMY